MQLTTFQIAWRNLGRNRKRTLLAAGAIALGQLTLVFVNCMMAGSFYQMLDAVTGPLVGHVQIHHPDWREERAIDLCVEHLGEVEAEMATLPHITAISPRIYGPVLVASGEKSKEPATAEPGMIVGLNVPREAVKGGILEHVSQEEYPSDDGVLIGRILSQRLSLKQGDLLALIGQDIDGFPVSDLFKIKGIIRSDVDVVNTLGVVMEFSKASAFLVMPDKAHEIIVRGTDYKKADLLATNIKKLPGLRGTEVLTWRQAVPQFADMMTLKTWFDFVFVAIVFIAAAAGIANTSLMSTFERTHEFGMLLAVGSSPGRVIRMVVIEALILGFVGVLIGSILGVGIVLLTSHTGINYAAFGGSSAEEISYAGVNISYFIYPRLEWRHVFSGLLAVTLTSVLASLWPATLAARLEPVEAMRR